MVSYSGFSEVYDDFMDNVPYDEWSAYVLRLLRLQGIEDGLVYDLACGTGSISMRLCDAGFRVIGIDNSAEMLGIAVKKKEDRDLFYVQQDMRELELLEKGRAFVCICDGMNYLLCKEDVLSALRGVHRYLEEGGIFIFDMNTLYKYREVLGDTVIAENREDMSFIWENYFDEAEAVNEYDLTVFVKKADMDGEACYAKFEELHYQKGYEISEMREMIQKAGFTLLAVYDAFTEEVPKAESERVYFVIKKNKERNENG